MSTRKLNEKIKNRVLSVVFVLVIAVIVIVVYRNYFVTNQYLDSFYGLSPYERIPEVYTVDFDEIIAQDIISDERFLNLDPNGGVPVTVGSTGKTNPFIPTNSR
ncbi:MAG TPA: hypothetical protein VJA22_03305 [Patescibacteria group bacterium]|nr:hypothetical protein [Patescibacteria group bacterium]